MYYFEQIKTNQVFLYLQGRLAMEWVIQKINDEIKDLSSTASKQTDEFIFSTKKSIDVITHSTKKSIDEISFTAKKSMDDLSSVAKKSLDDFLPTNAPQSPPTIPKL